jgi:hypothetical protein
VFGGAGEDEGFDFVEGTGRGGVRVGMVWAAEKL